MADKLVVLYAVLVVAGPPWAHMAIEVMLYKWLPLLADSSVHAVQCLYMLKDLATVAPINVPVESGMLADSGSGSCRVSRSRRPGGAPGGAQLLR